MVIAAGVDLTMPLVPLYMRDLGANIFQISLVTAAAGFFATLIAYFGGLFCDRCGRKLGIVLAISLAAFSSFMYTLCTRWEQIIPWVVLFNASLAFFAPARMAYIADRIEDRNLGRTFGMMNVAWPIGSLLGPLVGGYLSDVYGWNAAFYFVSLLSVASFLPAYLIKEERRRTSGREEHMSPSEGGESIRRTLFIFFSLQVLIGIGIGATRPLLPIYLSDTFHISRTEVGLFFTLSLGLTTLIAQISAGMILDRYGSKRAMLHSVIPIPIAFILLPLIRHYNLLMLDYMLVNGLWSVNWPASMDLLMRSVPVRKRGQAGGVRQTGVRLGEALGPLMGAYLWESFGPLFSFYASAAGFALCIPLILLINEPQTEHTRLGSLR